MLTTLADLFLLIAGPMFGAGIEGGGQRLAMSLALRFEAEATLLADAKSEGTRP